jgi:hypothetical protein
MSEYGEGGTHHVSRFFSRASCPGQSAFGPTSDFVSGRFARFVVQPTLRENAPNPVTR